MVLGRQRQGEVLIESGEELVFQHFNLRKGALWQCILHNPFRTERSNRIGPILTLKMIMGIAPQSNGMLYIAALWLRQGYDQSYNDYRQ